MQKKLSVKDATKFAVVGGGWLYLGSVIVKMANRRVSERRWNRKFGTVTKNAFSTRNQ